MAKDDRGFASMDKDKVEKLAREGGKAQGKEDNPGNFANRSEKDVRKAAEKGGKNSH